jgi:hypothetical protein
MALIDNLIRYYKFDENTGTDIVDSKGAGNATFAGVGTHWTPSGKINAGGLFASDSYASFSDAADLDGLTAISIAAWTYQTTVNVNNVICSKRSAWSSTGIPFELTSTGAPSRYFSWRIKGNGNIITDTDVAIAANTWYFVVGTWDGSTTKLYVNATKEAEAAASVSLTANDTNPHIGILPSIGENTKGRIDELGIWSRALTQEEITALYNGGSGLTYPFTTTSIKKFLNVNKANVKKLSKVAIASVKKIEKVG